MYRLDLPTDLKREYAAAAQAATHLAYRDSDASLSVVLDTWGSYARVIEKIAKRCGLSQSWVALNPVTRLFAYAVRKRDVIAPGAGTESDEILDRVKDVADDEGPWGGYVQGGGMIEPDPLPVPQADDDGNPF